MNSKTVSVIVPCYNEESTIQELLSAIHAQTYTLEKLEVVIADGMSTDRTRERINEFKESHPKLAIHIVENKKERSRQRLTRRSMNPTVK